jgi:PAS domain S-box-containing protein
MIKEKINVLLVEDEEIQAAYIKSLLDFRKYRIRHISDGKEALQFLLSHTEPDVVLLDNNLPSMEGIEIIHRLSIQNLHHPIVFISATADINIVIKAMREGALDFIVKTSPTFKTDLIQVINKVSDIQIQQKQKKELEQKIKQSEENYRNLFNEIDDYFFILDEQGFIVQVNNKLIDRLGHTMDAVLGKPVSFLHPEVFKDEFPKLVSKLFLGTIKTYYIPFESSIGEKIEVQIIVNKSIWNNQTVLLGIGKDISELKYSEERFVKAFHTNPSAMTISNFNGTIIDINESFCKLTGFKKEEIIGKTFTDLNLISQNAMENQIHMELLTKGQVREIELPINSKYGTLLYGIFSADLIKIDFKQCILIVITDITKRKNAENLLRQNEERLQLALKEGKIGLWDWNYQTGKTYITQSASEMLDYKNNQEYIDIEAIRELIHPEDKDNSQKQLSLHIKGVNDSYANEMRLRKADGNYKWILTRGKITERDEKGSPSRITGINIDIDKFKTLEQELISAKASAERANITKTRFMANISHEIRTPMTGILGMGKLLTTTSLDDKQKEYLNIILSSAENLLVIINDILDFSKITEGKLQLNNSNFQLDSFFHNTIQTLDQLAKNKDLSLKSYLDPAINKYLFGDPVRLNQILINLGGNAIKFTKDGFVEIKIELKKKEKNINYILFTVTDTGIGIDKENQDKIFDIFTQGDDTINRKFGGTGLGLAISRQLAEMMNGSINLESTKGVGSVFYFQVPIPDGDKDKIPEIIEINTGNYDLHNVRVLVAEDMKVNQFYIKSVLNTWNIEPDFADNGIIAVEMLKEKQYDIVFMDKQMPEMSGIEATRAIRYKLNLDVPIIALTAAAMKNDRQLMLKSGMNDYISKPYNPNDVLQKILLYVKGVKLPELKKGTTTQNKAAVSTSKTIIEDIPHNIKMVNSIRLYSLNNLKQLFGANIPKIKEMMQILLDNTPQMIVDIENEYKNNNLLKVGEIAHKIKPTLDMLEITSLTQIVREIEKLDKGLELGDKLPNLIETFTKTMNIVLNQIREDFSQIG